MYRNPRCLFAREGSPPRLATALDSLVRVSRRVARGAAGGESRARGAGEGANCNPCAPRRPGSPSAHEHRSTATISYTLHSLSRVLFNFPSRYLFSIGLAHVFSLGWDSPPTWDCDLKQSDSSTGLERCAGLRGDGALTLSGSNFQSHLPPDGARGPA